MVTDHNGLIYMRARYYSPAMRRFINADVLHGAISDSTSLNRYAYVNGNPVSLVDPFGLSAENRDLGFRRSALFIATPAFNVNLLGLTHDRKDGTPKYDQKYYNSNAYKAVKENAELIKHYADYYGVDPQIVAGVIFEEQYYNYNLLDVCTDWIAFWGFDMSVGLGQVRRSTAEFLEDNGYVPKTSATEGGWYFPLIGFVHGTENMARVKRLENNDWNIMYAAAYIKYFEDEWKTIFPEISSRPDILGTLYNIGFSNSHPKENPESRSFGDDVMYFYDLMEDALK